MRVMRIYREKMRNVYIRLETITVQQLKTNVFGLSIILFVQELGTCYSNIISV